MKARFRGRKTFRCGGLYAVVTPRSLRAAWAALRAPGGGLRTALGELFTSHGFKGGRVTHNLARRTTSIDTPGPGGIVLDHGGARRRGPRRAARREQRR